MVDVVVRRLPHGDGLSLPKAASDHAAGADLPAAVPQEKPAVLGPGERAVIATGFAVALPDGYEGQIRPRSGLALNHGITVLNAPGTIDSDYRGEIQVILINHGQVPVTVRRGMRIAQLVVSPVVATRWREGPLPEGGTRGEAGFGSTGEQ